MVIQRKVLMSEELRNLQDDVYELQDHVYGSEEFGSLGIYGVLKSCRLQLSEPDNGGDGHLKWTESRDLVAPETEAPQKIGLDEQDQIVGVSEEYLKDRIARFEQYKQVLQAREQRLQTKLEVCQLALKAHTERAGQAAKIAAGP